jgi:hypothetical protein
LEGVAGHVVFQKASASSLPFEEGAFDTVVSNLVFHEVSDVKDRKELLHEHCESQEGRGLRLSGSLPVEAGVWRARGLVGRHARLGDRASGADPDLRPGVHPEAIAAALHGWRPGDTEGHEVTEAGGGDGPLAV